MRRDFLLRLVRVAPLTLVAALAACFAIRFVAQSLNPSLANMGQLRMPMVTLTIEGTLATIVVFTIFALVVPRPAFWYRIVVGVALLLSLVPDVALALGGTPTSMSMRFVGPLASIGVGSPAACRRAVPRLAQWWPAAGFLSSGRSIRCSC